MTRPGTASRSHTLVLLAVCPLLCTVPLFAGTWKGNVEIARRSFQSSGNICFLIVEGTDGFSGRCRLFLQQDQYRTNKLTTGVHTSSQRLIGDVSSLAGRFTLTLQRSGEQAGTAVINPPEAEDGKIYRVGAGVTPPAVLFRVEPKYTKQAIKAKVEGTVILYAQIDPRGRAVNVRVLRGLGYGLEQSAIDAVSEWRFAPGYKAGDPVTVEARLEVKFSLNSRSKMRAKSSVVSMQEGSPQREAPTRTMLNPAFRELEFEGALETVTEAGVAIRLPDGRLIDAALKPDSDIIRTALIQERFIGDIVRIRCTPIQELYDETEDRVRVLALTEIRFIRTPTPEELTAAMASRHRLNRHNLLKIVSTPNADLGLSLNSLQLPQSPSDLRRSSDSRRVDDFIEKAQAAIATYIANIPNYTADETAERYQTASIPPDWKRRDSVKTEVRFDGSREIRQNIFLDNHPWTEPFAMLPGFKWRGGFGEKVRAIFDPNRPVRFSFYQSVVHNGRPARVYEFSAPKDSLGNWYTGYQAFYPAYDGKVTITEDDRMAVRLESKAKEFPPDFPISSVEDIIIWDWVIAGNSRQLLPVKADALIVHAATHQAYLTRLGYTNHRHFQSSSSISFGK